LDWTLGENKPNSKPILGKGKSKKAKGQNESKSGISPVGRFEKTKPFSFVLSTE